MFYVLEKIVRDDPHRYYAKCWNQQIIRPCNSSKKRYRDLMEGTAHGTITFEGCVCHQEDNESDDEFLLRASLRGYAPDFIIYKVRDEDWTERTIRVKDEEKACEYVFDDSTSSVKKIPVKGDRENV